MLLSEHSSKLQVSLDRLNHDVHCAPTECKMLFQDRIGSKPNIVSEGDSE